MHILKSRESVFFIIFLNALLYVYFAYFLQREQSFILFTTYSLLFLGFIVTLQTFKFNTKHLLFLAFGFRIVLLFALPNLSQDFYRFIWDGRLILQGINPYLITPLEFTNAGNLPMPQALELIQGMGTLNTSHFSNYPPLNQLCFAVAALFSSKSILGSVIVMRCIIIAADFGVYYFGKKILAQFNIPTNNIFYYVLNPFIIIELTGNLHFEGVMLFLLIFALYQLHQGRWLLSAIFFGGSIALKLMPLMLLPLLFKYLLFNKNNTYKAFNLKLLIGYYATILITVILVFVPFLSATFLVNYLSTISLWFKNFEFNASLYYVSRRIGYLFRGYNEIAIIGTISSIIVFCSVIIIAFIRKNNNVQQLLLSMLFALSIYYFTATTVHPWYIANVLLLSVFTNYAFPLVWSFCIMLSYFAYAHTNVNENMWIIGLEYLIIYSVFIWEVVLKKPLLNFNKKF